MPEIDPDILLKAHKGLTVGFIICICIVNILLIIKTTCKKAFVYSSPKNLTIISLALGDIFLALYSLVIYSRILFEGKTYECRFALSYAVYIYWVIHFVYGVGLIVLAVELMVRLRQRFLMSNKALIILKALVCSVIPWILGLAVVLPLTLVVTDWETCQVETTFDRNLAMFYVSVIIPAGLAVIICVIASCIPSTPQEVIYARNPQTTDVTINTTNSSTGFSDNGTYAYPYQRVISAQNPQTTGVTNNTTKSSTGFSDNGTYAYPYQTAISARNPQTTGETINTTNSSTGFSDNGTYAYPYQTNRTGVWNHSFVNTPPSATLTTPQQVTGEQQVFVPVPDYQEPIAVDAGREKIVLVITSIVFFLCVVPYAAFYIHVYLDPAGIATELSTFAITVLTQAFYWLSIFRSLVTPLIWLVFSARF